jgi:predicted dehydrogenase
MYLKVLFVGLGGIGQRHLRLLRSLLGDSLDITAYRERNLNVVITDKLSIAQGLNVDEVYNIKVHDSYDLALSESPNLVFICNPTSMHVETAIKAAKHGCHLFIEKALSDSMEKVDELSSLVAEKGLICTIGYQLRFHPCLVELKRVLDSRVLGQLIAVNVEVGEYMPGWHKYEDYRHIYASRKELGGGVLLSQIHEFDYIQWLFGFPSSLYALGGKLSSLEIGVEDVASVLLTCEYNGRPLPVHLHQDYLQQPPTRGCKVVGDKGKVVVDLVASSFIHYGLHGEVVESLSFDNFDRNQLFLDQLKHFVDSVARKSEPAVPIAEGIKSLKLALAAKRSIESGKVISLG